MSEPAERERSADSPRAGRELISSEPPTIARAHEPSTDPEPPESLVRPSAPTLDSGDRADATPKPIVVRTSPPPPPSSDRSSPREAISTTLRSGARVDETGLIGRHLGRYEVVEELGHGGMATVYRGYDPRLERHVALKVIHRHLRDSPEIAQRFRHEARAVAKLKHPSIVEIYDVPDDGEGERFLVAELVEGPSLRRYLQSLGKELGPLARDGRRGCMPPEIAASLVIQVLSALDAAHHEGIVHRDVKPENILIGGLGGPTSQRPSDPARSPPMAKLTDFGIAKILDTQGMTSTGQILGSPAHMAPEQIEGQDITARVDLFATGVLFYELLTGELPFDGKNPAQVIRRVLDGQFTPPDRIDPTIGGRWSAIVASLLARDPLQRPASAGAIEKTMRAELLAVGIRDPNAELSSFLVDPPGTTSGWPMRMKPALMARASEARAQQDIMGAAHDLNRALAYDPSDRKLVEAVRSLRDRARRVELMKRGLPLVALGLIVVTGTYAGVRALRNRSADPGVSVSASGSAGASDDTNIGAVPSTSGVPSTSTSTSMSATTLPATTDAGRTTSPTGTNSGGAPVVSRTRKVKFDFFPSFVSVFTIDGGPNLKSGGAQHSLPIGKHTLHAEFERFCCEQVDETRDVTQGEDTFTWSVRPKLKPATVFLNKLPEGEVEVTVRRLDGRELAHGTISSKQPGLSIPLGGETSIDATIALKSADRSVTRRQVLAPGNAFYLDP